MTDFLTHQGGYFQLEHKLSAKLQNNGSSLKCKLGGNKQLINVKYKIKWVCVEKNTGRPAGQCVSARFMHDLSLHCEEK